MKNLFGKFTFMGLITIALLILCVGLAFAGVIHPVACALPFIGIGAVKVREGMENIRTIKYSNAGATLTDTVYLFNGRVGLALNSAGAGVLNIYMIGGLIEYASETGVAWVAGDKIYWDDTGKKFTKTLTSNTLCGIAYEDKASAAATGFVLLIPTP